MTRPQHPATAAAAPVAHGCSQPDIARRFRRATDGWSCRALGEELGVSYETVRRYRMGACPIPAHLLARAALLLDLPAEWLLLGRGPDTLIHTASPPPSHICDSP